MEQQKIKEQYEKVVEDNINMKQYFEQDKKKFEDEQNKIKWEFNQNLTKKNSELQEALTKLDLFDKVKLEQENQIKMEIEKIRQYNKKLSFSNTHKHASCQVTEDGKVVAEVGNTGWHYCLCEQAIPKTGRIQFAFQMISGQHFHVGIGFKDIMQKNHYLNCYQTGYGTYISKYDGFIHSHHNQDLQGKKLSFAFTINDVIIIEVCIEHKYIKWIRQNLQSTFVLLDIDTSQELYPCVGVCSQSKIKLLDSIPVC